MDLDTVLDLEEMLPTSSITQNGTVLEERKVALEPVPELEQEAIVIDSDSEPDATDSSVAFVEKVDLDDGNRRALVTEEIPQDLFQLDTLHRCFVCKSRFRSVDPMRHHLKLHAKSVCGKCGEKFFTIPERDWHMRAIHGDDFEFQKRLGSMYFCRICSVVGFLSMDDASEHLFACHDEFLAAALPQLDAKVLEEDSAKEEPLTYLVCSEAGSNLVYYCESCDVFITGRKFNAEHLEYHRNPPVINREITYSCQHCPKDTIKFDNFNEYRAHVKKHAFQEIHRNRFYCLLCELPFNSETGIKRHILEMHVKPAVRTLPCPYCPELFSNNRQLTEHKAQVHQVRTGVKCESCGQLFSSNAARLAHRKEVHKEDLEYRKRLCKRCYKLFDSVEERMQHDVEVHGKKIVVC